MDTLYKSLTELPLAKTAIEIMILKQKLLPSLIFSIPWASLILVQNREKLKFSSTIEQLSHHLSKAANLATNKQL